MQFTRSAALGAAILVGIGWTGPANAADIDYLAATCAACHRPGATGAVRGLDGKASADLVAALTAFRDGTRPDLVMAAVTFGLDDATVAALADHFANRP